MDFKQKCCIQRIYLSGSTDKCYGPQYSTNITSLIPYNNYTVKIEAVDIYGRETSNGFSESFMTPNGDGPIFEVMPYFSNSSGTSTTINWQCSDDQLTTILYEIRAQRFKPGYSPTYVGVVFSGSGANNSSQSQTISSLDPEYIYEFNVQCKDTAGSYREPQIQLGINR